jgi:hypothetical protein
MSPARIYSLHFSHRVDEAFAREAGDEVAFVQRRGHQRLRIARAAVAQAVRESIEAALRARQACGSRGSACTIRYRRPLRLSNTATSSLSISRMSGVPSRRACRRVRRRLFDVTHALEAEPAHEAAGEARQARHLGHAMLRAQALDFGEGIVDRRAARQLAVLGRRTRVARERDTRARPAGR